MDQNEITKKTGPDQKQQIEKLDARIINEDHGTIEVEQPKQIKKKPARVCKICGGPNRDGCGCEAKARQETTALHIPAPAATAAEQQDEEKPMDEIVKELFGEVFAEAKKLGLEQAENIKLIDEQLGALCALGFDLPKLFEPLEKYLKVIADDLITIRKFLQDEHTEAKPKDEPETE